MGIVLLFVRLNLMLMMNTCFRLEGMIALYSNGQLLIRCRAELIKNEIILIKFNYTKIYNIYIKIEFIKYINYIQFKI